MSTSRIPEVFLSEIFGELRIIMEDNKFFFCAMDVCKALGYTNITRELNIHCRVFPLSPKTLRWGIWRLSLLLRRKS